MDIFQQLIQQITNLAGDNQFLSGGLAVYAMGMLTYLARRVPSALIGWFQQRFIARMTFDNSSWERRQIQEQFDKWYGSTKWMAGVRNFRMMADNGKVVISPGGSLNFFMLGRRLFWFRTSRDNSERMSQETVYVTDVATFSLWGSHKVFDSFARQFSETFDKKLDDDSVWVMGEQNGDWFRRQRLMRRKWDKVAYSHKVRESIDKAINNFIVNKDSFRELGLSRKLTFLFHGEPGTGKTDLARVIGSITGFDIYPVSLESRSLNNLERAFWGMSDEAIVLFEDIDSFVGKRALDNANEQESQVEVPLGKNNPTSKTQLSLSSILNMLDGVAQLENKIVIITTNAIKDLDVALYRKSRVDVLMEIKRFDSNEVWDYVGRLFPELKLEYKIALVPVAGCELSELLREHLYDAEGFVNSLCERYAVREVSRDFVNKWGCDDTEVLSFIKEPVAIDK